MVQRRHRALESVRSRPLRPSIRRFELRFVDGFEARQGIDVGEQEGGFTVPFFLGDETDAFAMLERPAGGFGQTQFPYPAVDQHEHFRLAVDAGRHGHRRLVGPAFET